MVLLQGAKRKTDDRAPDADPDGELHFVLERHPDGGDVLCGVGDDGEENEADEGLRDVVPRGGFLDGCDQVVRAERGDDRHKQQPAHTQIRYDTTRRDRPDSRRPGGDHAHMRLLLLFRLLLRHEQIVVRLQLEEQIGDVGKEQEQGCAAREDEQTL